MRRTLLIHKYFYKHCFPPYLVELCILHGGQVEPGLLALVPQHVIQQLRGRLHVVAVVMLGVIGGAVEQADDGLGAFAVHPGAVAPQLVALRGRAGKRRQERAGQGKGKAERVS